MARGSWKKGTTDSGGNRSDIFVYNYGDNVDIRRSFDGRGGFDTLKIEFTAEEWSALSGNAHAIRDELVSFDAFISQQTNNNTENAGGGSFEFSSMDLTAKRFEAVEVTIDGELIDIHDYPVVTNDDAVEIVADNEVEPSSLTFDVLANDSVVNGVADIRIIDVPSAGELTVNEDNTLTFTPGDDFVALGEGQTQVVSFTYEVEDEDGDVDQATVEITVTGVNDDSVATAVEVVTVEADSDVEGFSNDIEAVEVPNSGTFYIVDYDAGTFTAVVRTTGSMNFAEVAPHNGVVLHINPDTLHSVVSAASSADGVLTELDPSAISLSGYDGASMTIGNALYLQEAASDMTIDLSVEGVSTPDGFADFSISLTGVTYALDGSGVAISVGQATSAVVPSASSSAQPIVIEAIAFDPDVDDVLTYTVDSSETIGRVTNNGDGTFTYEQDNKFGYLSEGDTATDTFTYSVYDGMGSMDTETVTVTIQGENEAPDAQALEGEVAARDVNEVGFDASLSAQEVPNAGYWYVADYDAGTLSSIVRTTGTLTFDDVAPTNGAVLHINPNSSNWSFEAAGYSAGERIDVDTSAFNFSGYDGDSLVYNGAMYLKDPASNVGLTFAVDNVETPGGTTSFNFEVTGLEYLGSGNPVAVSLDSVSVSVPSSTLSDEITLTADAYDIDVNDTLSYTIDATDTLGSVIKNGDGTFTYSANNQFDDLAFGQSVIDTFEYIVDDGKGGTDTETISITVNGLGPEILGDPSVDLLI